MGDTSPLRELFPTDMPIAASEMIGRQGDVREVARALADGINTIIAGPRRIGKTSVCEAALARLRRRGFYVAAVDLFDQADAGDLAESVVLGTVANRAPLRRLSRRARGAGRALADAASATAVVKAKAELGEEIELAFRPGLAGEDPERALGAALALPERVARADGKHMVVFFDEFQEIAHPRRPYGDPEALTRRMRAAFQRSPHVSFLFAGSIEHLMRDLFAPADRALSQFGSFHELGTITAEQWRQGLGERFARAGMSVEHAVIDRIVELSGGHPRSTMLLARCIVQAVREERADWVAPHHVELGVLRALESDRLRHQQQLERIRDIRHGQRVAERIARGQATYRNLSPKMAAAAVRGLRDRGIIEPGATRGSWQIVDPLLGRYLAALGPHEP
jgi:hypothetical protein